MRAALFATLMLGAVLSPLHGQRGVRPDTTTGLLIVAHGAGAEWNTRVRAAVTQVRWERGPVAVAFLMGPEAETAGWNHGVDTLLAQGAKSLIVVPLLVSSHGGHYRQIVAMAAGADSGGHEHGPAKAPPVPTRVTAALDDAPELGDALAARWTALDPALRRRPVMLIAHGPERDAEARRWEEHLSATAGRAFKREGLKQPLAIGLLRDDAPAEVRAAAVARIRETITALATQANDSVLVITALISSSGIDQVKIPHDLDGLPVRYVATPLAPRAELARWIERVATESLDERARSTR